MNKLCQYKAPHCQKKGEYQHILKLGKVKIAKQWVCSTCKQHLEKEENN